MVNSTPTHQVIAADDNDLKNNRLGLMSQQQVQALQEQIDYYQAQIGEIVKRSIMIGSIITIVIVVLVFVRVLILPVAIGVEVLIVGGMVYMTTDFNRLIQQLMLDKEAGTVRIVKGRTSRYTMRSHPLYRTLRVEVQNYKILEASLLDQFENGVLYQLYVLPQSRVIISAEKASESKAGYLR